MGARNEGGATSEPELEELGGPYGTPWWVWEGGKTGEGRKELGREMGKGGKN